MIISKASELNIKKDDFFWSDRDIEIAKDMYLKKYNYKDIRSALNDKYTTCAIQTKLGKIGILINNKWDDEEIEVLIKYYENNPSYVYQCIDKKPEYIQSKARKLGLVNPIFWTKEEDEYIKNNYKTKNDYEIAEALDRTRTGTKSRRQKLGLESYFYNNFGNNFAAKDGTMCLSYYELEIHNFLITTNHVIQKEVYYKDMLPNDNSRRRLDWVIYDNNGHVWLVEYFGMYDMKRKENKARIIYKKNTRKKIKDLYNAGVIDKCIFIFPNDLKNKTLNDIFGKYIEINDKDKIKIS